MPRPSNSLLPSLFLLWLLFRLAGARILTLELHHLFSDPVKEWSRGDKYAVRKWPEKRSLDYYVMLTSHDRALHDAAGLTFSDGDATFRISSLGFLHYTTVTLGTPGKKFLVALDTGSDLFWVPCHCKRCASTDDSPYTSDFELSIYDPNESSTSKNVTCGSDLCTQHNGCTVTSSHCPYHVSYVSSETSTSGILVEDVLHLRTLDDEQEFLEAYVTFGCGQVQSGSFIDIAAPNGLFGLGFDKISVPSILSRNGYVVNSFSMCFGHDGTGRINFGDKGSLDQEETPFHVNSNHPTYTINVTQFRVGTMLLHSEFTALFDSGTSFTYLVDPSYKLLSENVQDKRRAPDPRIPFEYCYIMSPGTNTSLIPGVSLNLDGGGQLDVHDPVVVISTSHELVYCLAVVKSQELNIIGQNFMTGYRIVFDREKLILGWKKFNCYETEEADSLESKPVNYASVPPSEAVGLSNHSTQSDQPDRNIARNFVVPSLYGYNRFILIQSVLLFIVIAF